jgi:hypothetical protein
MTDPLGTILFGAPIPSDDGPWVPILSPRPGSSVTALIVCPALVSVLTHWIDSRTQPCTGPEARCEGCRRMLRQTWKGYLGGWDCYRGRYALIELTRMAADHSRVQLDGDNDLTGWWVRLARSGYKPNSAVEASFSLMPFSSNARRPDPLPAPFDVRLALLRVWRLLPAAPRPQPPAPGTR